MLWLPEHVGCRVPWTGEPIMVGIPSELIAVLAVAGIALLLRVEWAVRRREAAATRELLSAALENVGPLAAEFVETSADDLMAIEADGHVWLSDRHAVHRFSLFGPDAIFADEPRVVPGSLSRREFFQRRPELNGGRAPWMPSTLGHGDYTGARVVPGEVGVDPWRLEALGPDGEYVSYVFDSPEDARAALRLLETCGVVRRPQEPDGTPIPVSFGDFEEARLRWERKLDQLVRSLIQPEPPLSC